MLSKEKNNKVNIILRKKVICQSLVLMNFASKSLKFTSIDERGVEEGKEKKGTPMKVHLILFLL